MKIALFLYFFLVSIISVKAQDHKESNYDEAKVPQYTLPDPLKTEDGKKIRNKTAWEKTRKSEILRLFENNIYGPMPKDFDSIKFTIVNEDPKSMNGKAHLKEVRIDVFRMNKSVSINLVLFIPNNSSKPVPAFLLISR